MGNSGVGLGHVVKSCGKMVLFAAGNTSGVYLDAEKLARAVLSEET